jgi:tight adherence protein B
MNEFAESLGSIFDKPLDQQAILWLAAAVAITSYIAFFAVQRFWGKTSAERDAAVEGESSLVAELKNRHARRSFADRLNVSFDAFVQGTGLGLSSEQILGWIALAGTLSAVGLYVCQPSIALALVGMALGVGATLVVLVVYRSRQRWRVQEQLPDIFYSLARSARGGLSVEKAIGMLARQKKLLVASEFQRCAARMELGMPAVVALDGMAQRLGMIDFDGLVAVIGLHQNSGGNLPVMLERLAASSRDHNQFRSYVRTATALGQISALCLGMATPLIFLGYAIVQPEFCWSFFQSTYGWTMVAVALGLDLVGGIWLFFLLRIEY